MVAGNERPTHTSDSLNLGNNSDAETSGHNAVKRLFAEDCVGKSSPADTQDMPAAATAGTLSPITARFTRPCFEVPFGERVALMGQILDGCEENQPCSIHLVLNQA
jgi:hypothetical protein